MTKLKSMYRLERSQTALLVIDVQEKLLPAVQNGEALVARVQLLLEAVALLGLPVVASEQYPKGLGPTVAALRKPLADAGAQIFEKISFGALTAELLAALRQSGCRQILVCGMETHVCVWQTARELLEADFDVLIIADAVSSRRAENKDWALAELRDMGARVTSSECVLFDLLGRAGTPEFKALSQLIK